MPYGIASATKANLREAAARIVRDWWPSVTTSAGTTTTLIDSSASGNGDNIWQELWDLITDAAATPAYQYRIIDSFTASTDTLRNALSAAPGSGKSYNRHKLDPSWYTEAAQAVVQSLFPWVYRPVTGFIASRGGQPSYGLPRAMRKAFAVHATGHIQIDDDFDRADSATAAGGNWVATVGTWGISSDLLYSASDADGDLLTQETNLRDGVILVAVQGTLNSGATYRSPAQVFRYLDSSNYLLVRLLNGSVALRKVDGSSESSLTTATQTTSDGVPYVLWVRYVGSRIEIWADSVLLVDYELTGRDLKYVDYTTVGIRLDKAGSPATAARVRPYLMASQELGPVELRGWRQDDHASLIHFENRLSTALVYTVDGAAPLSQLDDDTYVAGGGTLVNDTTAKLEIQITDPQGWRLLATAVAAEVCRRASAPGGLMSPDGRAVFAEKAAALDAEVGRMIAGGELVAPRPSRSRRSGLG